MSTEAKLKTIPLLFATNFMSGHPKQGEPTEFVSKIKKEIKIHTIRGNFEYWNKKIQQVRAGEAYLSLRTWTGKPYRSKQQEFMRLHYTKGGDQEIGIQKVKIDEYHGVYVEGSIPVRHAIAQNDGLTHNDFHAWFSDKVPFEGAIIHFTNFRY